MVVFVNYNLQVFSSGDDFHVRLVLDGSVVPGFTAMCDNTTKIRAAMDAARDGIIAELEGAAKLDAEITDLEAKLAEKKAARDKVKKGE